MKRRKHAVVVGPPADAQADAGADVDAVAVADAHAALHAGLHWRVPRHFNIAEVCCSRWARRPATAGRTAIAWEHEDGRQGRLSYAALKADADRLSRALQRLGVQRGDRVAVVMPQRPETAVAHMALYQLGAVAMPLSMLFGPDALSYRLQDSGALLAIADESAIANVQAVRADCPGLRTVMAVGDAQGQGDIDWAAALGRSLKPRKPFAPCKTLADDPAVLIYTSGTTGPPKGALIAHRGLIGNLSGFVCSQNWFGSAADEVDRKSTRLNSSHQ